MPESGGIADKTGNFYENLWTVSCVLDLIRGEYVSIDIEAPDVKGVEFVGISSLGHFEGHQAKRQKGAKNYWTINELDDQGVVRAFWDHTTLSHQSFIFVSQSSIQYLSEIHERMYRSVRRRADPFARIKTTELKKALANLRQLLGNPSDADLAERLSRLKLVILSEQRLEREVRKDIRYLINGNSDAAFDALLTIVTKSAGFLLTRDTVIKELYKRGLTVKEGLALPIDHSKALELPRIHISRDVIIRALEEKLNERNQRIILYGVPGVGKTTFIKEFIEQHLERCFYFFIEADWITREPRRLLIDLSLQMSTALGDTGINFSELPLEMLKDNFGQLIYRLSERAQLVDTSFYIVIDGLSDKSGGSSQTEILDLVNLQQPRIYVIATTNSETFAFHLPYQKLELLPFSSTETEAYVSRLGIEPTEAKRIHSVTLGGPLHLDHLRRQIEDHDVEIQDLLNDLAATFSEALDKNWNMYARSAAELQVLATLATAEFEIDQSQMSEIARVDFNIIEEFMEAHHFVEIDPQSNKLRFISETHKTFVVSKVTSLLDEAKEKIVEFLIADEDSDLSRQQLPLVLASDGRLYPALKNLLTVKYLARGLTSQHSLSILRRNCEIMIQAAAAQNKPDYASLSKFSLFGSIVASVVEKPTERREIEALLALGEHVQAMEAALRSLLIEDRLELLSVVGKHLKTHNDRLFENVQDEVSRLIGLISSELNVDRMLEIAEDLFEFHPQSAIDLLEKTAVSSGTSLDILLMNLAMQLSRNKSREIESLGPEIKNVEIRQFVNANSWTLSNTTAADALGEIEQIRGGPGKLHYARNWCENNRENRDAIIVVQKALEIMLEMSGRESINLALLRQVIEPLAQYSFSEVADLIVKIQELKQSNSESLDEFGIGIDLLLARIEATQNQEAAHIRLLQIVTDDIASINDLDIRSYCYTQVLRNLPKIDAADEKLSFTRHIIDELKRSFVDLLNKASDHAAVTSRILRGLVLADKTLTLEFVKLVNTLKRRDQLYSETVEHYVRRNTIDSTEWEFIIEVLGHISARHLREKTLLQILKQLAHKAPGTVHRLPSAILDQLYEVEDIPSRAFGYCFAHNLTVVSETAERNRFVTLAMQAWEAIPLSPRKTDTGFDICIYLAPADQTIARQFFEITYSSRDTAILPATISSWLTSMLILANQSILSVRKSLDRTIEDIDKLIGIITEEASSEIRLPLLGDLAVRLYANEGTKNKAIQIWEKIIKPEIRWELIREDSKTRRQVFNVAHIFFTLEPSNFRDVLLDFENDAEHDDIIYQVLVSVITGRPPLDPKRTLKGRYLFPQDQVDSVFGLLQNLRTDIVISRCIDILRHSSVTVLRDVSGRKSKRYWVSENSLLRNMRRLNLFVDDCLPYRFGISHDGYKIVVKANLRLLAEPAKRKVQWKEQTTDWPQIIAMAHQIPVASDRVIVLSKVLEQYANVDEQTSLKELAATERYIEDIQNSIDRPRAKLEISECYIDIHHPSRATELIRSAQAEVQAMRWSRNKDELTEQITEQLYKIDAQQVSQEISNLEDGLTKIKMQDKVQLMKVLADPSQVDSIKFDHPEGLQRAADELAKDLSSGIRETPYDDTTTIKWLKMAAQLPLATAIAIKEFEIENSRRAMSLGQYSTAARMSDIYNAVIEAVTLIREINLFRVKSHDFLLEAKVTPSYLQKIPLNSPKDQFAQLRDWLTKQTVETFEIYDGSFSYSDVALLNFVPSTATVEIHTSWNAQGREVNDTSAFQLFQDQRTEVLSFDGSFRVSLYQTNTNKCPLDRSLYFINSLIGLEISHESSEGGMQTFLRVIPTDETKRLAPEYRQRFLLRHQRTLEDELIICRSTDIVFAQQC